MARLIKCPRCQSQIDVTSVSGGTTVRCSDCGAMVRVPTGSTGVRPAVPAQAPAAAPATRTGGKSTSLFKKMAGTRAPGGSRPPSRSSNEAVERRPMPARGRGSSPAMIGLMVAGGLFVLVILLIFLNQSKQAQFASNKEAQKAKNEQIKKDNERKLAEFRKQAEEDEAAEKAEKAAEKAGKKPALQKDGKGGYTAPATFEPGAARQAKGGASVTADPTLLKEFESLASSGKIDEIVREPGKWFPAMLVAMLSDNEPVARGAFQAIHDMCKAKNITTDSGKNPVRLDLFTSSQWRGGEHMHWSDWWEKPQNKLAMGVKDAKLEEEIRTKGGSGDPSKADWDKLMRDLRAGGAFDAPDRPEGKAFSQVKGFGAAAYPYLTKYIDNEDILLAKAAVKVLNILTGREGQMPNDANKSTVKAEWEAWIAKQGK
ncbi:MAG TPA: hypothetical protein VF950_15635 [Planctomycetota bacterium]